MAPGRPETGPKSGFLTLSGEISSLTAARNQNKKVQMIARDVSATEAHGILRDRERMCSLEPKGCQKEGSEAYNGEKPGSGLVVVHFSA